MSEEAPPGADPTRSPVGRLVAFCVHNRLLVALATIAIVLWGLAVAPFDWDLGPLPRDPVPTDAIPDIGENQQIVFTEWPGRSPRDVEDQITYPLTAAMMGMAGVETVRSVSMFGFSSIYVIFDEGVEFYWSRSRMLEKLSSLPAGLLPEGVQPTLGPDATALGQVFWYTLEGRDARGRPSGGWDLDELRSIQDYQVRYALLGAGGISEVASVGGFVREYQVDVDPDAMRTHDVTLHQVMDAVRESNADVGARTIEVNGVEYVIRGVGLLEGVRDIASTVVTVEDSVPIRIKDVAHVTTGPALRRGALDKGGTEVVGGVVVVRHGHNPLEAIAGVKDEIREIAPGLPARTLPDGTVSRVTVVPFYDRTDLIHETLGTLGAALADEILVTVIVVLISLVLLRSALIVSGVLPLAVLLTFIAMKTSGVDANIVALSGIAIAVGTIVDMGIVVTENIVRHLERAGPDEDRAAVVIRAASEVGGAVVTAVSTTIIGFLPVFTMVAAEGKLFRPLAFTKTFALLASIVVSLTVLPPLAHALLAGRLRRPWVRHVLWGSLLAGGVALGVTTRWWLGLIVGVAASYKLVEPWIPGKVTARAPPVVAALVAGAVGLVLASQWLPLGPERGLWVNALFVLVLIGSVLGGFWLLVRFYARMLAWCLDHKAVFLSLPALLVLLGGFVWLGFDAILGWLPDRVRGSAPVSAIARAFPGLGEEFMPALDEGSFLYMPTTMPHASIGEAMDFLSTQDMSIAAIPEVSTAVGKIGRVDSPLDPAPISMIETVVNYHPEYATDDRGRRLRWAHTPGATDLARDLEGEPVLAPDGRPYEVRGRYDRDGAGRLVPDPDGMPFRLWRPPLDPALNPGRVAWEGIRSPGDIWNAVVESAQIPGTTGAPELQPIAARLVMLQSGMRAPMGVKVKGPDLESIEEVSMRIETLLGQVPSVREETVAAERIVGKPYLEIRLDRDALARHGASIRDAQDVIEVAVGGKPVTTTVEGRERYPVRVRYMRELRDSIESISQVIVPTADGHQIPLGELAQIEYVRGPQAIKSEDGFLVGYVLFDKREGRAEVDVVDRARRHLEEAQASGDLELPPGVSYSFAGSWENHQRSTRTLMVVLPLALLLIFVVLYLQFRSVITSLMVFSGVLVAWSGGFLMIWLYGQGWFMDFTVLGTDMRDLFQVDTVNLSVAVWVGFLALFGIATDDGVIMATYLDQRFGRRRPGTVRAIRRNVIEAAQRRIRPAIMTVSTTILALLPVLTSTGRGSEIMVPMAIPTFGGMALAVVTVFVVPTFYCLVEEMRFRRRA